MPADLLAPSLRILQHRGPDDEGTWASSDPPVVLGHRRLAVIDLSHAAAQPMVVGHGQHALTFNGEIYNHLDLRQRLEQQGHRFRTTSDTEALLLACRFWGPMEAVTAARGMFAFAYVDVPSRRLWLIRDRFGEKPLYWSHDGDSVLFASELKALERLFTHKATIDRRSLATFLSRGAVPQPSTIYEGVHQVPPGTALRIELSGTVTERDITLVPYWDAVEEAVRARSTPFRGSLHDAAAAVHETLRASVRRATISDRPIGAFLSGGVDSSLVTALMQEAADHPLHTFTVGFNDPRYDESASASAIAREIGTEHTSVVLSPAEALAAVPSMPAMYDEPFADPSQLPTYLVARVAREKVTVALSGDGGDELFGGYRRHITSRRTVGPLLRVPRAARSSAARAALRMTTATGNALRDVLPRHDRTGELVDWLHKVALMADFADAADLYDKLVSGSRRSLLASGDQATRAGLPGVPGVTAQFMLADTIGYLPDDILVKIDRAAMSVSLETRVPFLDPDVFHLAWSLPMRYKVSTATGKVVLRRVLASRFPPELIDRPKSGFGPPLAGWLRGPLRSWADDLLAPDTLRRQGHLHVDAVRQIWAAHRSGGHNHAKELWNVLMFQAWLAERGLA